MDSLFDATTLIRERLLADSRVKKLIGEKIYPVVAPSGTEGEHVIVYRKSYQKQRTKATGVVSIECAVGVLIFGSDYDRSVDIAKAIDNALDTGDGAMIEYGLGGESIELVGSIEDYVDSKYYQELEYVIKN